MTSRRLTFPTTLSIKTFFHELDHLFWSSPRADGTATPLPAYDPNNKLVTVYGQGYTLVIDRSLGINAFDHLYTHNDLVGVFGSDSQIGAMAAIFNSTETTVTVNTPDGPRTLTQAEKIDFIADFMSQNATAHLTYKGDSDGSVVKAFMKANGAVCNAANPAAQTTEIQTYYFLTDYQWVGTT